MRLHLGCGKLKLNDFINVDLQSDTSDLKLDFRNLTIFNSSNIEEIYISHALEHCKRSEIIPVILEFNRILKIDGVLRVAVPDFEKVVKMYLKNRDMSELIGHLSGGQKDELDFHYIIFDVYILQKLLNACGFDDIERYNAHDFLGDKDDYSKSYLPHMDFENGELLSLNIICKKKRNVDINNLILCEPLKKFTKF